MNLRQLTIVAFVGVISLANQGVSSAQSLPGNNIQAPSAEEKRKALATLVETISKNGPVDFYVRTRIQDGEKVPTYRFYFNYANITANSASCHLSWHTVSYAAPAAQHPQNVNENDVYIQLADITQIKLVNF